VTFSLEDLDFLASPAGEHLLVRLAGEDLSDANTLALLTALRKDHDARQAGAVLTMARLRRRAVEKFGPQAARMFFTEDGLQQASSPAVSAYRAQTLRQGRTLDVCCGIGTDSLALARAGHTVTGLDLDPVRIAIARHNAAVTDLDRADFQVADVCAGIPSGFDAIFYDPARRDAGGRRIYDVERYIPPLSLARSWQAAEILVKLSPGVDLAQLSWYGGVVEFVSVDGELKEALLWLNGADHARLCATLLHDGQAHHWQSGDDDAAMVGLSEPLGWLAEPDPAVIRAGLVGAAARRHNGYLLDETIAYFTTDDRPVSPWLRSWRVLDWMPFHLKKLRAYLRQRGIGQVTVKKRGSPLTPEELISRLKLKGDGSCTLVLTRCQGRPIVVICDDYAVY
jgi:SAM-dependent methyltransferase